VGSWAYAGLIALGLSMTGIAMVAVPLSVIWLVLSIWLARRQERAEHESDIEY
jgi:ATP:ADP antiporter, AAA family